MIYRFFAILCICATLLSCSKKNKYAVAEQADEEIEKTVSSEPEFSYQPPAHYLWSPLINISQISESYTHDVEYLIDSSWHSWTVTSENKGIGESFAFTLIESKGIQGFALKNGHGHLDRYSKNNRVKMLSVYADDKFVGTIAIKDSISFEQYAFTNPVECKNIRFVIDEIYPAENSNNTCIAEIALLSEIATDSQFYESILFWLGIDFKDQHQYYTGDKEMQTVDDPDKMMLLYYLPFDIDYLPRTQIARLGSESTLKFNVDPAHLPRLDGATAMYPLYSAFVHAVYPEIKVGTNEDLRFLPGWGYFPNIGLLREALKLFSKKGIDTWTYGLKSIASIVQCNTTSVAYQRLIDGETDIIFVMNLRGQK